MEEDLALLTIYSIYCLGGCCVTLFHLLIIAGCVSIAGKKNRSGLVWGLLGFFFSFWALIVLLLLPPVQPAWPQPYGYRPPPPPPPPYPPPSPPPSQPPPPPAQKWSPPPEAAQATMIQEGWRLAIIAGPDSGQSYALAGQSRIGRHPDNEIRLTDSQVSRYHALIQRRDEGYVISDLGSGNGVYVNGKLISGPARLAAGDAISVGVTQMRVSDSS